MDVDFVSVHKNAKKNSAILIPRLVNNAYIVKLANGYERRRSPKTKLWLFLIYHLIGCEFEAGASFLGKSQDVVEQNQILNR